MRSYFVYIATNRHRTVFYTGMTNDVARRMAEHRSGKGSRFTARYRVRHLLFVEAFAHPTDAIAREKEIKGWRRSKKLALVKTQNPTFRDLMEPG